MQVPDVTRNPVLRCLILLLFLAVAACNDGDGSSDDGTNGSSSKPPVTSAAGIWAGDYNVGGSTVYNMTCLISKEQELACRLYDATDPDQPAGAAHINELSFSNSQFSGQGVAFTAQGYTLPDGSHSGTFSVASGKVEKEKSLSMAATVAGKSGTITLTFDSRYNRDSDLKKVSGVYQNMTIQTHNASFVARDDGTLNIQSDTGSCRTVNGTGVGESRLSIIDSDYNLYDISLTMTGCGPNLDGDYSGLATLTDTDAGSKNDALLFMAFSTSGSSRGITAVVTR